jgi:hypothetical protein
MNVVSRLAITGLISVAIAFGLALIPQMQFGKNGLRDSPSVLTWAAGRQLTEQNVVDFLVQMPLQLRIRKVELTHSILSIDLNLPRSADEDIVIRDLYTVTEKVIRGTTNINQVLVRVMDYSSSSRSSGGLLLLALDANRNNGKDMEPVSGHENTAVLENFLRQHFQITYTDKWKERYPM